MNAIRAQLESSLQCLGFEAETGALYSPDRPGKLLKPEKKKGTAAVYSAPYGQSAWRAGKGKAAVGLNGDHRLEPGTAGQRLCTCGCRSDSGYLADG